MHILNHVLFNFLKTTLMLYIEFVTDSKYSKMPSNVKNDMKYKGENVPSR